MNWDIAIGGAVSIATLIVQQFFALLQANKAREWARQDADTLYLRARRSDQDARERQLLEQLQMAIEEYSRPFSLLNAEMSLILFEHEDLSIPLNRAELGRTLMKVGQESLDKFNLLHRLASQVNDAEIGDLMRQIRKIVTDHRNLLQQAVLNSSVDALKSSTDLAVKLEAPTTAMTDRIGILLQRAEV